MAKRPTAIDKAIQRIDDEIAVLQHARAKLVEQQAPKPPAVTDLRSAKEQAAAPLRVGGHTEGGRGI